jgi:catechol 2,3-dioxygenase-like lactoylglutathione lyase family enzyme
VTLRGLCPLLQVFDRPTSLRFYRDVLGFAEVSKSGQGDDVHRAWLRHGVDPFEGEAILDEQRSEEAEYDRRTKHGTLQGARFP